MKAGTMQAAVQNAQAVELGDGRVLAVGWNRNGVKTVAELWDPATNSWRKTESLNKNRSGFVLVALDDGRALVAGGMNDDSESFSSAYVFDPATEHWSKVGLMHTARTDPVAAVLSDGRILVAGGRYSTGPDDFGATTVVLASYHADARSRTGGPVLADADPGPTGRALATAEIFDPRTGTWSQTGPMRYARVAGYGVYSAVAATLGDGRVLVFGTDLMRGVAEDAGATTEIYDPVTGTFSAAAPLPQVDPSDIDRLGISQVHVPGNYYDQVALVTLDDGDALLIGTRSRGFPAEVTRNIRFDADAGAWREVGEPFVQEYDDRGNVLRVFGDRHPNGFAVALGDGRVLVGGGLRSRVAQLLDPDQGNWTSVPRLPASRSEAEAVRLSDGSVLVIGTALRNGKHNDRAYRLVSAP